MGADRSVNHKQADNDMSNLDQEFDRLTKELVEAQRKCNKTYNAWQQACREFDANTAARRGVWMAMMKRLEPERVTITSMQERK